jgi:hypothetical protein
VALVVKAIRLPSGEYAGEVSLLAPLVICTIVPWTTL